MTLLDQVKGMQQQGLNDEQIIQTLREQGFSSLEINEALNQSKIRSAVFESIPQEAQFQPLMSEEEMQPSVMETQMPSQAEETLMPEETPEYIYPTPQAYSEYEAYEPYQAGTETMTEIAESITDEKISKIKKTLHEIENFKITAERKIKNIDERLRKIEETIERLQASIIGKIGSYGQTMQDIKKEMEMMQTSFSKALPSLAEKKSEHKIIHKTKKIAKSAKSKKSGIEHYLKR